MNDLIPLGTGNSRFMKSGISPNTTYQQLLTMLINGTFPFDFNGINPAGISQMGSAYNVANVLPADVCSALNIPTTSEPKDAFFRLSGANNALRFITKYVIAGNYQWSCPKTANYFAVIIGGGGSGSVNNRVARVSGGASGYVSYYIGTINQGNIVNLIVGAGGAAVNYTGRAEQQGKAGGTSSFNNIIAEGGEGGNAPSTGYASPALGGQCSNSDMNYGDFPAFNGATVLTHDDVNGYYTPMSISPSVFLDERGLPISMMCAGGGNSEPNTVSLPNGKTMSAYVSGDNAIAIAPTDCGAGGGSVFGSGAGGTSAPGADGGVFIYEIQETSV